MKGNVIGFDPDSNIGAISGHDGQRYEFVRLEWRGPNAPSRGAVVDFMPAEGRAMQIYPVGDRGDPAEGREHQAHLYPLSGQSDRRPYQHRRLIMAYVNRADAPDWV